MRFLYHASQVANIDELRPFISNHGVPRIYFSSKRENVLVYLSNAVEKYCKESGFEYSGIWCKWASYGFDKQGKFQIEEYYPDALIDTYKGVSGYIYSVVANESVESLQGIKDAYVSSAPISIHSCEFVEDAYEAILEAEAMGQITVIRYDQLSEGQLKWLQQVTIDEYAANEDHPEYRHFLKGKFPYYF